LQRKIHVALNKTDAAKFQVLQDNVSLLVKAAGFALADACASVADKIAEFEEATQHKVLTLGAPDEQGNWLTVVDLRRDFLRIRTVGDGYTMLKSRALGVSVDVKVARGEAYSHDNDRVASALEKLAAAIRLQEPLAVLSHADLAFTPGEEVAPVDESDDEELDSIVEAAADAAPAAEASQDDAPAVAAESDAEAVTEQDDVAAHEPVEVVAEQLEQVGEASQEAAEVAEVAEVAKETADVVASSGRDKNFPF
jgi:hypothetical protein